MRTICCWLGLLCWGCVADFPTFQPTDPLDMAEPDRAVIDAMPSDGRPPDIESDGGLSDGMPPMDMRIEEDQPDLAPGRCRITAAVEHIVLRTWNDAVASEQIVIRTDCDTDIVLQSAPDWLTNPTLEELTLKVSVDAARGVRDGEIVIAAANADPLTIPVRAVGLAAGNDRTRRALLYVVDGLKGDTLENTRPPALDWLSKQASRHWDGVPHRPVGTPTRESGWASLLSGLAPAAHEFDGRQRLRVPTFADRVPTAFAAQWRVISEAIERPVVEAASTVIADSVAAIEGDARLVIAGVDGLLEQQPGDLPAANTELDAGLDALLAAIAQRPPEEDWLIVVTAATSGAANGPPDLPIIFAAPQEAAVMVEKASLMDVHTSILRWLGVLRPGWDLPGEQILGGVEANCDDRIDNDGDGRVDCRDADCVDDCQLGCIQEDVRVSTGPGIFSANLETGASVNIACSGADDSLDLAVHWTAAREGNYIFSTHGSRPLDPVMDIKREHCGGDRLACNDDLYDVEGPEPSGALLRFVEGESAVVFLSDWNRMPSLDQPMRLNIVHTQTECETAPTYEDGGTGLLNDDRIMRIQRTPRDDAPNCGLATAQTMLRWQAPVGRWRIQAQSDFDMTLSVWRRPCDALQQVDCINIGGERVGVLTVREPTDYLLVFASVWNRRDGGATGPITVTITPAEE